MIREVTHRYPEAGASRDRDATLEGQRSKRLTKPFFLSSNRMRLYCLALFVIGLPLFPATFHYVTTAGNGSDWGDFWTAGSTVGTDALLSPAAHTAWGEAHRLPASPFVYVPAAAWLLAPAAHTSLAISFIANAALMLIVCGAAAVIAAKTYGVASEFALLAIVGWAPTTAAVLTGQNSPLGLLLTLIAIFGFSRDRSITTGVAVGILLYKPTYAIPFVLLLVAARRWQAVAIVASAGGIWYLLSVAATAGDWAWPTAYARVLVDYVRPDFAGNATKAISLSGVMLRLGTPALLAYTTGAALLFGSIFLLARVSTLEAASVVSLIGLAASAHAWEYDAILVIPALLYAVTHMADPWRGRLLSSAYVIAPLWAYSMYLRFDTLAAVVVGGTAGWFALQARDRLCGKNHLDATVTRSRGQ